MGMFVEVIKSDKNDENFVYYTYQFSIPKEEYKSASGKTRYKQKTVIGSLKIEKKSGNVYTIKFAEGDSGSFAKCASWALIKY